MRTDLNTSYYYKYIFYVSYIYFIRTCTLINCYFIRVIYYREIHFVFFLFFKSKNFFNWEKYFLESK